MHTYGKAYVRGDWQSRSLHVKRIHKASNGRIIFLLMCVTFFFICRVIDSCLGDLCKTSIAAFVNTGFSGW